VLAQSHPAAEIIVADDGSEDDTAAMAHRYAPKVSYLRQPNQGKAAALNLGIAAAQGDTIVVLDDDDLFPTWALAAHKRALDANPKAGFSYGRSAQFRGLSAPPPQLSADPYPTRDPRRLLIRLMEHCFISNPAWAARRAAQTASGPYDVTLRRSQDFDMILRLSRDHAGVFIDDLVFYQRTHASWRGPQSDRTYAVHTTEKWVHYNVLIFERIDRTWPLSAFAPFEAEAADFDEATLHLQRGVILFLRKVYVAAEAALNEYLRRLGSRPPSETEIRIASGLMDGDYGIGELLAESDARAVAVRMLRMRPWPFALRMAFASQIRWRLRAALTARDFSQARALAQFASDAFGPALAALSVAAKCDGGAGAWRGDHFSAPARTKPAAAA
jgi:glycosyltransferase involved in cell wall biosynthesis